VRAGGRERPLQPKARVREPPPGQSLSVTFSGPSLVTLNVAEQSTRARVASIVTCATFMAAICSVSRAASLGAGPQLRLWLVYGIAGI
jgi:hypothetical protein